MDVDVDVGRVRKEARRAKRQIMKMVRRTTRWDAKRRNMLVVVFVAIRSWRACLVLKEVGGTERM